LPRNFVRGAKVGSIGDFVMANAIDLLMDLDPLMMTPEDISSIIDYHRRNRQNFESGVKPKKETGPVEKINLAALGLTTPDAPIKRRV
jgi:hypothetical protein